MSDVASCLLCVKGSGRAELGRLLILVADPRDARGLQYPALALLCAAVSAVLTGARSLIAISQWITDAQQHVLGVLGFAAVITVVAAVATEWRTCTAGWRGRRRDQRFSGESHGCRTLCAADEVRYAHPPCVATGRRADPVQHASPSAPDRVWWRCGSPPASADGKGADARPPVPAGGSAMGQRESCQTPKDPAKHAGS
ncbi:transposase family protein [Streptomyces sp. NPDC001276]|uniref:transposase family protein n=1 Tax=Streptomyces sp. NPDC001276 TaxID=3364555 RepID=UPI00369F953C